MSGTLIPMDQNGDRKRLGDLIHEARLERFGTVEKAMQAAGVNRATWKRAEEGKTIRDDRMVEIERALGWAPRSARLVLAGGDPKPLGEQGESSPPASINIADLSEKDRQMMLDLYRRLHAREAEGTDVTA